MAQSDTVANMTTMKGLEEVKLPNLWGSGLACLKFLSGVFSKVAKMICP